jgi:translocation and assembly module TamA
VGALPRLLPRPLVAALAVLALGGCLHARGTQERPAITGFELLGTRALDEDAIREKLVTQPSGRFFWQEPRFFDEDAFANDARRVERAYQAEGYYRAQVVERAVVPDGAGRVKLRMRVEEGPPTLVSEVQVDGLDDAPEARRELGRLPLRVGGRFTEPAFDATRERIEQALAKTGWANAEVEQLAFITPDRSAARVTYTVKPGRRYRFGNVFVSGAAAVPRERLQQEAAQIFRPGEWFDATKLERVQGRVFDLGVFGGVRVSRGPPDEKRGAIPVVVSVREAPFRTVRVGPDVAISATRYEAALTSGWTHRNWQGGLRRLALDARLGYAFLPDIFTRNEEGLVARTGAEFTQPNLIRQRIDVTTRLELERGVEEAYRFWSERARVSAPLRFGRSFSIVPSYNLELYQVTGAVQQDLEAGDNLLQSCGSAANCVLSFFEQRVTLDLRDDPINTRRGFYASLSVQEGFQLFGVGFPYLRFLPEGRVFLPVWDATVLAARLRVGTLRALGSEEPPLVARLYGGGPTVMRGYYTRQLSPVVFSSRSDNFVPVGGSGLVDGSVELRFDVTRNVGLVTFLDFGNTTVAPEEALDPGNFQYAAGTGFRYKTPFGPLRVDVAARLPRRTGGRWEMPGVPILEPVLQPDGVTTELEDLGNRHTEPIVSVHLSLGEAF